MRRNMHIKFSLAFTCCYCLCSCTFNFQVASQRTALENQMLGTYTPVERPANSKDIRPVENSKKSNDLENAQLLRQVNAPEIKELKKLRILGENKNGELCILPKTIGNYEKADLTTQRLSDLVVKEENRSRRTILEKKAENKLEESKAIFLSELANDHQEGDYLETVDGRWIAKKQEVKGNDHKKPKTKH